MPNSSTLKRLLQGGGANMYETGVSIVVQLASVPILLHAWGTQLYGSWLVLFSIPAYLSLTSLGYWLSIANEMTMRIARHDRMGAVTAYHSLISLVVAMGLAVVCIVVGLVLLLPVPDWLHLPGIAPSSVRIVVLLLAAEVLAQLMGGVAQAGYRATGDYGLGIVLGNTVRLAQYTVLWAAALAGLGVTEAAAAFLVARLLGYPPIFVYLSRRHRWLRFGIRRADWRLLRNLGGPSVANLMLTFANALKNEGLILVVNILLGPATVATFSVLRTLTRLSLRAVYIVSNAIAPEITRAAGAGQRILEQRLYLTGQCAALWVTVAAGAVLCFAGEPILHLWTHGRITMDYPLFFWLLGSAAAAALWNTSLTVLQALNCHQRAVWAYVLTAPAVLGLSWVLVTASGHIRDVGVAMLVGDGVFAVYMMKEVSYRLVVPFPQLIMQLLTPLQLMRDVRSVALRWKA